MDITYIVVGAYLVVAFGSVVVGVIIGRCEGRSKDQAPQEEPAPVPSQDPLPEPVAIPVSHAQTLPPALVKLAEADLTTIDDLIAGLDAEWQRQRGQLL